MKVIPLLVLVGIFCYSCKNQNSFQYYEGETMGTTFHIKYQSPDKVVYSREIDSLLYFVNQSLSTYISNSTISKFNQAEKESFSDTFFEKVFLKSKEIYKKSSGAFDPTVMPLVNAWGFGFDSIPTVDSFIIDSLLNFIGFDHVSLNNGKIVKDQNGIMLDFSAIAKGFGVDVIGFFFESKNIQHYMVEIGGEVRVKGHNANGDLWQVGIEKPDENERVLNAILNISNKSIATSGNYRNFYYKDGKRYAHTINPETGYPIAHNLLSATVVSNDCMTADAWATAFMVLGKYRAIQIDEMDESIDIYLIYENNDHQLEVYISDNLKKMIRPIEE